MIDVKYIYLGLLILLLVVFITLFRSIIKKHHDQTTIKAFGVDLDSFVWLVLFIALNFGLIYVLYYAMRALSNFG